MPDAIHAFAEHVAGKSIADFDDQTIGRAKALILDTIGVGLIGTQGPQVKELRATLAASGTGTDALVWGTDIRLPAQAAAFCNAYQSHNSEFDCIHEAAVAHVLTVVLPVALAGAERAGAIPGTRLIEAAILGVDVAANLGIAATSGLRFFRPATAGLIGGAAALSKIMDLDPAQTVQACSIAYGQLGGTMQAHTEGSMLLATQMGFSARNAVMACDLAVHGITGPVNILEGPFGYFNLIEDGGNLDPCLQSLGRIWRINEVAHKPFPSGRATHGIVDGCLELRRAHKFAPSDIDRVTAHVPPLVHHLVGRPVKQEMAINYARLCAAFVAACALLDGTIRTTHFTPETYAEPARQRLAQRIGIAITDADPNALTPVTIEINLKDGRHLTTRVDHVYGASEKPMSRDAYLQKFRDNARAATLDDRQISALIAQLDALDRLDDVSLISKLMVPGARP